MEQDALFAYVNDSIRTLASEHSATPTWQFICECPDVTCHTVVTLTLNEFDAHRTASPYEPILAAQHDGC